MADLDDDELLEALGVEVAPIKAGGRTPREERIIAGFEDILRFHEAHQRAPQHGEGVGVVALNMGAAVFAAGILDLVILRLRNGAWEFPSGAVLTAMIVAMVMRAVAGCC